MVDALGKCCGVKKCVERRPAESLFLISEPRYLTDLCISDFHSKSPDLVTIILDLSKVTVPEE